MDGEKISENGINDHLDSILDELGNFGKYQIKNYTFILIVILLNACLSLGYVFTTVNTPHRCMIPECDDYNTTFQPHWLNHTIPFNDGIYDSCRRFAPYNETNNFLTKHMDNEDSCPSDLFNPEIINFCDERIYADTNTIVGEFDIGCDLWKRTLVGTIYNIGLFLTMPFTGIISDKFGRKRVLIISLMCSASFGLIKTFSVDYWMFLVFEFLDPLSGSGAYSAAFILGVEYVGPKYRIIATTLISIAFTMGQVLLAVLAYFFPYWKDLIRVIYGPTLLVILYFWLIPESVRWLLSKGRTQEAGDILKKAAQVNKVKLSEKTMELIENEVNSPLTNTESTNKVPFKEILNSKILVVRVLMCSFWWLTCTFVFYGLSLNSVEISGNIHLNFILVSLIEIPAYVTYYFTMDRFGRKYMLCASFLGSAISCFGFAFVSSEIGWLKLTLYMIGKYCITLSFGIVYIYTTEIFPTPFRHFLLGICSMLGRIGSIIAPQMPLLSNVYEPLPLILFGIVSLISGVSIMFFPETLNIKLPDTIEEAENISEYQRRKNKG